MSAQLQIVSTGDGSNTILHTEIGEQYHSKHGAIEESKHVFLKMGFEHAQTLFPNEKLAILEIGFGTGLNYLLTLNEAKNTAITFNYSGVEAYPLEIEWIQNTAYQNFVAKDIWNQFLLQYENHVIQHLPVDDFEVFPISLADFNTDKRFHLLYYDAFSVQHQPEMWSEQMIQHACKFLMKGGVFVTYAITGNLKRNLKSAGFEIQKLPGAPGKREMLRAIKQ